MNVTIELHWWLLAYLAIGVALVIPLNWLGYLQIAKPRGPFWKIMRRASWRQHAITILLWPAAIWEAVR